jgi:nucleoid-associated protein YgaU
MVGCGPAMYAPPPQWPTGGNPQFQQLPNGLVPNGQLPPQPVQPTFAPNQPIPNSLDDVAEVPANEVLKLPPTPKDITWHSVQTGDTLESIARRYSVTVDVLVEANAFSNSPTLRPGQQIRIP